jgi:hypothetical protein
MFINHSDLSIELTNGINRAKTASIDKKDLQDKCNVVSKFIVGMSNVTRADESILADDGRYYDPSDWEQLKPFEKVVFTGKYVKGKMTTHYYVRNFRVSPYEHEVDKPNQETASFEKTEITIPSPAKVRDAMRFIAYCFKVNDPVLVPITVQNESISYDDSDVYIDKDGRMTTLVEDPSQIKGFVSDSEQSYEASVYHSFDWKPWIAEFCHTLRSSLTSVDDSSPRHVDNHSSDTSKEGSTTN